ncbi:MAG: M48 family metallopeptidase [Gammaproteobacteria bacterium]|nr:M48 family metallopeptidase [Gammaproteobacteria bacterium]
MSASYLFRASLLLYFILMPATIPMAYGQTELPDLGQSDTSLVTRAHERKIAEQVMRNLRHADLILDDPELSEYIQSLGHRISRNSEWQGDGFHFFIIKDMEVNAFALPAGYIGIHIGLFLTSRTEDELASVLAHEIAHITQRHYSRGYEFSKQQNALLAAAVIAALAIGSQDSNASAALLMGGMANSLASQLSFSRGNEREADWLGIDLLTKSGYNPRAMASFFERLQQANRYNESAAPEYLRTHPVTTNRISDARSRAQDLEGGSPEPGYDYELMWHKLAALSDVDKGRYQGPEKKALTQEYSQALEAFAKGRYQTAMTHVEEGLARRANQPSLLLLKARIAGKNQRPDKAIEIYEELHALYPSQISIHLAHAELLLQHNRADEAKHTLRQASRRHAPDHPQILRLLADSEMKLGNRSASHRYLADYYFNIGNPHAALRQVEIALQETNPGFYEKEELEARYQMLQQHIQLLAQLPTP